MNASAPQVFRLLLVGSVTLAVASAFVDQLFGIQLEPLSHSARSGRVIPGAGAEAFFAGLGVLTQSIGVVAFIGLFLFKRWARPLAGVSVFLGLGLYLLSTHFVVSGLVTAMGQVSDLMFGAALAMAFSSPVRELFAANQPLHPTPTAAEAPASGAGERRR